MSMESFTETIFQMTEIAREDPPASDRSGIPANDQGELTGGSAWVELPASIVSKLREANRRTGLSLESLVWDAVDFYLQEKVYQWAMVVPAAATLPAPRAANGKPGTGLRRETSHVITGVAHRHSTTVDEAADTPYRSPSRRQNGRSSGSRSRREVTASATVILVSGTMITHPQ